jgi:hypothetical protein
MKMETIKKEYEKFTDGWCGLEMNEQTGAGVYTLKRADGFESDLLQLLELTLTDFTEYVKHADNMPDRELIKSFLDKLTQIT